MGIQVLPLFKSSYPGLPALIHNDSRSWTNHSHTQSTWVHNSTAPLNTCCWSRHNRSILKFVSHFTANVWSQKQWEQIKWCQKWQKDIPGEWLKQVEALSTSMTDVRYSGRTNQEDNWNQASQERQNRSTNTSENTSTIDNLWSPVMTAAKRCVGQQRAMLMWITKCQPKYITQLSHNGKLHPIWVSLIGKARNVKSGETAVSTHQAFTITTQPRFYWSRLARAHLQSQPDGHQCRLPTTIVFSSSIKESMTWLTARHTVQSMRKHYHRA